MTPAEELRAAARLMRQRAQAATPGPWRLEGSVDEHGFASVSVVREEWDVVVVEGDGDYVRRQDNAEHIAGWHPLVAQAAADLLDGQANSWDQYDDEPTPEHLALAFARAYLRGGDT